MEKIELLEKLVNVQEMHIELMQDYNNLKLSFEAYKEVKIGKINNLLTIKPFNFITFNLSCN